MLVKSKRRVLGVPLDNSATSYHRVIQPLFSLMEQRHPVQFLGFQKDQLDQYKWAEILYIQCLYAPDAYQFYADWKSKGKKIIIDFDDDYINIPEDSPEQTEIIDKNTGKARKFSPKMRSLYVQMFIQLADMVTVTNNDLRSLYLPWNKNIKVIPNCVSPEMKRDKPKSKNEKIRILWTGSSSHLPDLDLVKKPLQEIVEKYGDEVEIHLQSTLDEKVLKEIVPSAICHPAVPFGEYLDLIQDINADIAIAPLRPIKFNLSKSNLKYSQMTLMESAFVGSDFGPYKNIDHGEDGLLASNEKEWFNCLSLLIEHKTLREKLVKNATKYVNNNYMLDKHLHRWREILVY